MALDLGEKRIGVALNRGTSMAFPHTVIEVEKRKNTVDEILEMARECDVDVILVGWPLRTDGTQREEAARASRLKKKLEQSYPGEVVLWDERFSTREAERRLLELDMSRKNRRKVIDQVAAACILQSYLDCQNP